MGPMQPHCALQQSSLIDLIIAHFSHRPPTLLAAALVNRQWSTKALAMLWAQPPPQALETVTDAARRLFYAEFVTRIVYDDYGDVLLQWAPLLRPRVLKVSRDIDRLKGTPYPLMLRPNLRRLQCTISAFARPTMQKSLARLCPHLADLVLRETNDPTQPDHDCLAKVLRKQRGLARVVFEYNERFERDGFPSRIFEDMAARDGLRLLKTTGRVSTACLARVFRSNAQPFGSLNSLRTRVHSGAVRLLAVALPRLTFLTLELCDGVHSPFAHLEAWSRLATFSLHMPDGTQLGAADFARIAKLGCQVRALGLDPLSGGDEKLLAPSFTDSSLLALAAAFPCLSMFNFNVASRVSANALRLLGENCPHLERLVLSSYVDLRTLDSAKAPLFPALTDLILGGVFQHVDATP